MRDKLLTLFLEINQLNFIFFVTKSDDRNNFKTVYKIYVPIVVSITILDIEGIKFNKENIYLIEKNLILHLKKWF